MLRRHIPVKSRSLTSGHTGYRCVSRVMSHKTSGNLVIFGATCTSPCLVIDFGTPATSDFDYQGLISGLAIELSVSSRYSLLRSFPTIKARWPWQAVISVTRCPDCRICYCR